MLTGFITIIFGVFFIYMGALQIAASALPKEMRYTLGTYHGKWLRGKIGLEPIEKEGL